MQNNDKIPGKQSECFASLQIITVETNVLRLCFCFFAETSEDISPYATFQLSEAGNMSQPHHGGPANTLLHSFMYHERALAEGCSSPPPAAVLKPTTHHHHHHHNQRPQKTIHNYYQTSPFHNIVRLFIHFFDFSSPLSLSLSLSSLLLSFPPSLRGEGGLCVLFYRLLRAFYVVSSVCSCLMLTQFLSSLQCNASYLNHITGHRAKRALPRVTCQILS